MSPATVLSVFPFAAGFISLVLGVLSLVRKRTSPAAWCFFAGMVALGADSVFMALSQRASRPDDTVRWLTLAWIVKCILPAIWLCFSLTYSRSNYREFLGRWRIPLAVVALLPIGLSFGFRALLLSGLTTDTPEVVSGLPAEAIAKGINAILLIALVLTLMNLEQTFRSAVGTMRWRIKFVVLGLAVIFGTHVYSRSQAILFSGYSLGLSELESGALLIGCLFLAVAYARTGLAEIDVYPSLAVLRSSLTVLIVGGYLFVVGILAQLVRYYGGAEIFQLQAYVVLLGMAGLAVLLLSDRARQRIHTFSARHFSKSQHDSVRIWSSFSQRVACVKDQSALCAASARLISETFDVLSVSIWLLDDDAGRLVAGASTARPAVGPAAIEPSGPITQAIQVGLRGRSVPFDLDGLAEGWAEHLRQLNPTTFTKGGNRLCIPLRAADECLGAIVLADRVRGAIYTIEELELLRCISEQMTSVLLNLRLAAEVAHTKELDAFRTMSAFFVHDLKNAAASLNLTLRNLPVHFDDPAFREDAMRAVGNTARRLDEMIGRLSAFRNRPQLAAEEADLNRLVNEVLDRVGELPQVALSKQLQPLPSILADREQIQNVVTNLVLNAREAVGPGGRIEVRTDHRERHVVLSVADNGCGMSPAFVKDSLFRPFQSTKKSGLGIGLFQCRAIVRRHGGGIQVESELGKGTTFLVSLPVMDQK